MTTHPSDTLPLRLSQYFKVTLFFFIVMWSWLFLFAMWGAQIHPLGMAIATVVGFALTPVVYYVRRRHG